MKGKLMIAGLLAALACPAQASDMFCYWVTPSTSVQAPDGTVTTSYGTPFQKCMFVKSSTPGEGGGGGGTGGGIGDTAGLTVAVRANDPNNPERAHCGSSVDDRRAHANKDTWRMIQNRIIAKQPILPLGTIVIVSYDDGGAEAWILKGYFATEPLMTGMPIPSTLQCPKG